MSTHVPRSPSGPETILFLEYVLMIADRELSYAIILKKITVFE